MVILTNATADIFVHLMNFPDKTKETVCPNEDGSFTIFINSRLSYEGQLKAYNHAMKHIKNEDFNKSDVQTVETVAHRASNDLKPVSARKYLEELKRLEKRRKKLQQQIKKDEERINYLSENCDIFARAEAQWLYGSDL